MLNVKVTLQQRCGNVLTKSGTDVATTLIFDRATTLSQHQPRCCGNVVAKSLCRLGSN